MTDVDEYVDDLMNALGPHLKDVFTKYTPQQPIHTSTTSYDPEFPGYSGEPLTSINYAPTLSVIPSRMHQMSCPTQHCEEARSFLSTLDAFRTKKRPRTEEDTVTLFVSNVAYEARTSELKAYFTQHVPVLELSLQEKRDRRTGVRVCFALLTLYSMADAEFCLQHLNDKLFLGRRLQLRFDRARPRKRCRSYVRQQPKTWKPMNSWPEQHVSLQND